MYVFTTLIQWRYEFGYGLFVGEDGRKDLWTVVLDEDLDVCGARLGEIMGKRARGGRGEGSFKKISE